MDKTTECLRQLREYAEKNGAVIERVEVSMHQGGRVIGFVAHLAPKPIEQSTVAVSYEVE